MIYLCAVLESTTDVTDATGTMTTEVDTTGVTTDESTTEGMINLIEESEISLYKKKVCFFIYACITKYYNKIKILF